MSEKRYRYIKWLGAAANVIAVVYFLGVAGTVALINPARPSVSEIEKRELAKMPEFSLEALASGSYTQQLSTFFADTFPLRDSLIQAGAEIKEHMGFRLGGIRLYGGAASEQPDGPAPGQLLPSAPALPSAPPAPFAPPPEGEPAAGQPAPSGPPAPVQHQAASSQPPQAVEPSRQPEASEPAAPLPEGAQATDAGVRLGSILTSDGIGYTLFGGSEEMGQWYGQVIKAYGDILGDGMRIYNIVVPTSVEFNLPQRYKSMTVSQRARLDNIKEHIGDRVEWVDIYDEMAAHSGEYLYFRTDHHWTSLGAYYAYREFAGAAGFEPVALESLERRTLDGFLGTLYSQTQDSKMLKSTDHVDYYILPEMPGCHLYKTGAPNTALRTTLYGEYAASYNSYSVFMHGDFPVFVMDTGLGNGRRIAVVKESYGNAFVPFLAANYERVVVIDQRYLQKGLYEVLEQYGINELLFINNILAAHTPVRIQELATLPSRSYTPPPPEPEQPDAEGPQGGQEAQPQPARQQ